jgi:hypothetical protein
MIIEYALDAFGIKHRHSPVALLEPKERTV